MFSVAEGQGRVVSGERLSVSGAGSPQQSGSPPTSQPESQLTLFRRRDFEGRERELMERLEKASSSDASSSQKQRGARSQSAQQQQIHTHTHTRKLTTPHGIITTSFFSTSPSFSLPSLHYPFFFHSLSLPVARPRTASPPLRRPSNLGCFRA